MLELLKGFTPNDRLVLVTAWGDRPIQELFLDPEETRMWDAFDGEKRLVELKLAHDPDKLLKLARRLIHSDVQALKLSMTNERFQLVIMNDTEPSARDVAAFERDLKDRKVRVLFYNKQAATKLVQHLIALARASSTRCTAAFRF